LRRFLKGFKLHFPATEYLVRKAVLRDRLFTLIDVGCSGGIAMYWRVFGKYLRAYGIDPMINEIKRLQAAETNPEVNYWAGYIGLPANHPLIRRRGHRGTVGNSPWDRLSTIWALEILSKASDDEKTKISLNRWPETKLADKSMSMGVDEFVIKNKIKDVDFIKIDVDGEDFCALHSCGDIINSHQVLGFMLEVNFFGEAYETDHTFHNTDRFMRSHGFELFDLNISRYSRRALPAPFVLSMPAQTKWGAPVHGDALYVRDVAGKIEHRPPFTISTDKLLKLVALYEIFSLPDCAAELLTVWREQLSHAVDVDVLLDLLTPEVDGRKLSYQEYIASFSNDVKKFYPRNPGLGTVMLMLIRFMWRVARRKVTPSDAAMFKAIFPAFVAQDNKKR
jgi:Methyltransferase FkbM domain